MEAEGDEWKEVAKGLKDVGATFIHGDFGNLNILVDPATKEITAVLDFEFSQSGPFHDEYFQGLIDYFLLAEGTRESPTNLSRALQALSLSPSSAPPPASLNVESHPDFLLAESLILHLHAAGAKGPWTAPASLPSTDNDMNTL